MTAVAVVVLCVSLVMVVAGAYSLHLYTLPRRGRDAPAELGSLGMVLVFVGVFGAVMATAKPAKPTACCEVCR
jgi:hypothetical protein